MNVPPLSRRQAIARLGLAGAAAGLAPSLLARQEAPPVATPPAGDPAGFYRLKVGEIGVTVLSDGMGRMPHHPTFAMNATAEEATALANEALLPARMPLHFNIALLSVGSRRILVDTGSGPAAGGMVGRLLPNLRAAGLAPADITDVVISHAHGDHLAGIAGPDGLLFPNARHLISRDEHAFWTGAADLSRSLFPAERRAGVVESIRTNLARQPKWELVDSDAVIAEGVRLVPTPGHTPGHVSVDVRSGDARLFILSDLAHHALFAFRKPEWHVQFDTVPEEAAAMRRRMYGILAGERVQLVGFHMPFPGIGYVRTEGDGFEWVPAPWEWSA
jgi:glyoxylase-like metal-dependent hydrolase (beta-lactamase superfamily II)